MDNFWESSSDSEFCILEVLKRCCGHCSIFVYLYLLRDFSPFTTTPVLVPLLLHNRKRSSVLVGLKVLGFLHIRWQFRNVVLIIQVRWKGQCVAFIASVRLTGHCLDTNSNEDSFEASSGI